MYAHLNQNTLSVAFWFKFVRRSYPLNCASLLTVISNPYLNSTNVIVVDYSDSASGAIAPGQSAVFYEGDDVVGEELSGMHSLRRMGHKDLRGQLEKIP